MAREPTGAPRYLRPNQPVAERVLLPGDPARALRLAVALTEKPLMLNHARGLWGYTGTAADGELLTIQSTGLGGPSAEAVIADLIALGARRGIRVGTCTCVDGSLEPGTLVTPDGAEIEIPGLLRAGARVRDMTTAAVLRSGLEAGAVLVVDGNGLDEDALHAAELAAGEVALSALRR